MAVPTDTLPESPSVMHAAALVASSVATLMLGEAEEAACLTVSAIFLTVDFLRADLPNGEEERLEAEVSEGALKSVLLAFDLGTFCAATCCLAFFNLRLPPKNRQ